jgi:hypothetical protein
MFESKVLRKMFQLKKDEQRNGNKLCREELHVFFLFSLYD